MLTLKVRRQQIGKCQTHTQTYSYIHKHIHTYVFISIQLCAFTCCLFICQFPVCLLVFLFLFIIFSPHFAWSIYCTFIHVCVFVYVQVLPNLISGFSCLKIKHAHRLFSTYTLQLVSICMLLSAVFP